MAVIIIKRNDANAVRASDLLSALHTSDTFFAQVEKLHNRMQEMSATEVETIYGVDSGVGAALKTTIENLYNLLITGDFDAFRSQLG